MNKPFEEFGRWWLLGHSTLKDKAFRGKFLWNPSQYILLSVDRVAPHLAHIE
jgi:hypothetical protein